MRAKKKKNPTMLTYVDSRRGPLNWRFFCPQCGDLWAGIERGGEIFGVLTRPCARCFTPHSINGSLFQDFSWIPSIPKSLIPHEFNAHILWAERVLNGRSIAEITPRA